MAGIGVHIASRVLDQAEPSEILVSRTVRDLVAGSDIAFRDMGYRELKGARGRMAALRRLRRMRLPRLELNGRSATLEQIWSLDLSGSGHFTAMQVRGGRTLGMDLHLARLDGATRELFGVGLDGDRVRGYIRHALAEDAEDASVRVNVFRPSNDDDVSVMVSVRPPASTPAEPQSLQTVEI